MEKLNEYLQTLVDTMSYELHLEPNKNPYIVSASGNADVANTPLLGTQISTMVFPLIPNDIKQDLPNQPIIQFVHPHNLGKFSFTVAKTPVGFSVTIKPLLSNPLPTETGSVERENESGINFETDDSEVFEFQSFSNDSDHIAPQDGYTSELLTDFSTAEEYLPSASKESGNYAADAASSLEGSDLASLFEQAPLYEPPISDKPELPTAETTSPSERQNPQNDAVFIEPVTDRRKSDRRIANTVMRDRMEALLQTLQDDGSSYLHLSLSFPPMIRKRDGKIQNLESEEPILTRETIDEMLASIMPSRDQDEFKTRNDTRFIYEIPGLGRFRCSIFMSLKGMAGVFQYLPSKMPTAEGLGLLKPMLDLCSLTNGLVLVSGPANSGKSSTLCALVDHINHNRDDHIITIEDPILFVHENSSCYINQREVPSHTASISDGLRAARGEDPDIIVVDEVRDEESISAIIDLAEAGKLVFAAVRADDAPSAIDRMIENFSPGRQKEIRSALSEVLKGVISHSRVTGTERKMISPELLTITPAISDLIRDGKTSEIDSAK